MNNDDRKVLYAIIIVAGIAVLASIMLAVLAISDAKANEIGCPPHSTIQPYGGPDRLGVHVTQPVGEPRWAYVILHAPDEQTWTWNSTVLFGQFTNSIAGQWYVCFTQDLDAVLAATGWGNPVTPTTTTTSTTIPTVAAEPAQTKQTASATPKPTAAHGRIPRNTGPIPR